MGEPVAESRTGRLPVSAQPGGFCHSQVINKV